MTVTNLGGINLSAGQVASLANEFFEKQSMENRGENGFVGEHLSLHAYKSLFPDVYTIEILAVADNMPQLPVEILTPTQGLLKIAPCEDNIALFKDKELIMTTLSKMIEFFKREFCLNQKPNQSQAVQLELEVSLIEELGATRIPQPANISDQVKEKQTKIFIGGRNNIRQSLSVIDGITRQSLQADEIIDPFSLEPIEEPSGCTFRRERPTLGTVEYTLCDMTGKEFGNITLTKLAENLTEIFFYLVPDQKELRWGLMDGIRDKLYKLIDNTAEYAKFMVQAVEKPQEPAAKTSTPTDKWTKMGEKTKEHFREAARIYRCMEQEYLEDSLDGNTQKKPKPTLKEWKQRLIYNKVNWRVGESRLKDVLDMLNEGVIDKI